MFKLKRKETLPYEMPQYITDFIVPIELNHDVVIDINNKENQELLNLLDEKTLKFQHLFKDYYRIIKELTEIKLYQKNQKNVVNADVKKLEQDFIKLEKEAKKLNKEFPVLDKAFLKIIINNFTPKQKEIADEK